VEVIARGKVYPPLPPYYYSIFFEFEFFATNKQTNKQTNNSNNFI